ncbi:MAG: Fe-S cluster assembly protein SufD [Parachlamydiaceae bacterium]|nr:Fe-S cluster assembly protein SufD [Parachlamydiaceae bacterium]
MMTEERTEMQKDFQSLLLALYGQFAEPDALQKIRAKAWDHFLALGLPTKKDEVFRYVRLNYFFADNYEAAVATNVAVEDIEAHVLPECQNSVLVFVNGHFNPLLSRTTDLPKKAVVTLLTEAMCTFGSFLNNQLGKSIKEETDPFAAINTALHCEGLFLYLPPKTIAETPIQVLNVIDPQGASMLIMPRLQIFAGAQSELKLASTQVRLSEGNYVFNMVADVALEEDAHMKYTQVATGIPDKIWHFDALRVTVKRNSTFKSVSVTDGAKTVRHDYRATLIGENADVHLNGICMLGGQNESHTHVLVDHQAPNCHSMQMFKCVLNDSSKSSFEGKILVRQAAQKTEAFQLNNNLLLSDQSHSDSKPNLEIFADDVKASHGATFGQLDKEHIFYMKTRGFSEAQAKSILVYGFCQEVIDLIEVPSLQAAMTGLAKSLEIN